MWCSIFQKNIMEIEEHKKYYIYDCRKQDYTCLICSFASGEGLDPEEPEPDMPPNHTTGIRRVIGGKIYDTSKAEHLCDIPFLSGYRRRLYKTSKGDYFIADEEQIINIVQEDKVKEILSVENVDSYKMVFGDIEEG